MCDNWFTTFHQEKQPIMELSFVWLFFIFSLGEFKQCNY